MPSYTHTYNPTLKRGTSIFNLNQDSAGVLALSQRNESYNTRIAYTEIPLQNGAVVYNAQRGPLRVSFSGTMTFDTKEDLLEKKDTLVEWLIGGTGEPESFTFYTYLDETTGNRRYYRDCYCDGGLSFDPNSNTGKLIDFTFSIIVPDGREYSVTDSPGPFTTDTEDPFVTINLLGPRTMRLSDSSGDTAVTFVNNSGDIMFKIDSVGNVFYTGVLIESDSIS